MGISGGLLRNSNLYKYWYIYIDLLLPNWPSHLNTSWEPIVNPRKPRVFTTASWMRTCLWMPRSKSFKTVRKCWQGPWLKPVSHFMSHRMRRTVRAGVFHIYTSKKIRFVIIKFQINHWTNPSKLRINLFKSRSCFSWLSPGISDLLFLTGSTTKYVWPVSALEIIGVCQFHWGWQHVGITNTLHIEQDLNMSWSHGTFSGSAVTCGAELDGKQVGLEYLWNLWMALCVLVPSKNIKSMNSNHFKIP